MGYLRCACGAILTTNEIKYYGATCDRCERGRSWEEAQCTDCDGTGITIQTERPCSCQPSQKGEGDD